LLELRFTMALFRFEESLRLCPQVRPSKQKREIETVALFFSRSAWHDFLGHVRS